jgi:hypothetical protein
MVPNVHLPLILLQVQAAMGWSAAISAELARIPLVDAVAAPQGRSEATAAAEADEVPRT